MASSAIKYVSIAVGVSGALYAILLGLLTTNAFQAHVVYLHAIQMTWFENLDVPQTFGFLHNQVTPFAIAGPDGRDLYAWHVLPLGLYEQHETALHAETSGFVSDITSRLSFRLLQDDPDARLIIHMHGAGGTVGSGYRCPNYRALSAGDPARTHVLTFDYRGFGRSPGSPSEEGLIRDAITVVKWAMDIAKIPPSRVVIYSQSLGTAVNMATAEHFATQKTPIVFAGHILTAPFIDVPTLVSTYRVAGTIPILGPLAHFPMVFDYLRKFIRDKWSTKDRIAKYVRANEVNGHPYRITLLHAEDDYDIPWTHTSTLFEHAARAAVEGEMTSEAFQEARSKLTVDLGHGGTVVQWQTQYGVIREEILKFGLHDVVMGSPSVTLAVTRMFRNASESA